MKNKFVFRIALIFVVLAAASAFTGCNGKASSAYMDEEGCYIDIDEAMKAAKSRNQNMFVIFTRAGDDAFSEYFVNTILKTDDFKSLISSEYVVVHMDFSDATYQAAITTAADSKAAQKKAEEMTYQLQKNSSFADMMRMEYSPCFFLMTKDEYFVSEVNVPESAKTAQDVLNAINEVKPIADKLQALADKTKTGTNLEKIAAIDEIYEGTYPDYRTFLADLVEQVLKLDKNNESGLLSKYLLADAENSALAYFYVNDIQGAVNSYIDICSNQYIAPEDKQQAYYMAAYLLSYSGSDDLSTVIQYLQYAVQAYPEGENVPGIQQALSYMAEKYSEGAAQ